MSKASNYYYEQLNKEQQKAYYAMKEGLLNQQDSFAVPMLDKKELSDIYFMVRMDCPEIFYSVRFSYRYYPDSTAVEFIPEYLFQKDKIREHRQAMQARVKKLARQAQGLDEKGKELFIHDFIVQNVRYDKLKKSIPTRLSGHWEMVLPSVRAWQKPLKSFVMSLESGVLLRCRRPITKRESSTVMRGMLLKSVGSIIMWMQRLTIRSPKTIQSGMIM